MRSWASIRLSSRSGSNAPSTASLLLLLILIGASGAAGVLIFAQASGETIRAERLIWASPWLGGVVLVAGAAVRYGDVSGQAERPERLSVYGGEGAG